MASLPLWLQLSGVTASELASFTTLITTQRICRERVGIIFHFDDNSDGLLRASWHHLPL